MRFFRKFYDYVKGRSGWFFIILTVLLGAGLYLIGKYFAFGLQPGQKSLSADICTGLGTLILVSGVSGAIMKILAVEGFFLDAVAEDAHGERGLARLNDAKLHETWLLVTRMLYLRNMESDSQSAELKALIAETRSQFERELPSRIPSSERHFLQWHDRTLDITWSDRAKGIISIDDVVNSELIPFRSREPLSWTASIHSEVGQEIDEFTVVDLENKLRNSDGESLVEDRQKSEGGRRIICRFTSSPKERHEIWRHRSWKLNILKDPNFFTISPYIVRRADIRIRNNAEGLMIGIVYFGNDKLFDNVSGSRSINFGESAHIRLNRMLLPEQGYGLTLIKLDAPSADRAMAKALKG